MAFIALSGMRAVTTGRSAVPETCIVLMSAAPNSSPRSEGLIGVASMRTSTSSAAARATGTLCSETSSSPLLRTSERSCSAVDGMLMNRSFVVEFRSRARPRACAAAAQPVLLFGFHG